VFSATFDDDSKLAPAFLLAPLTTPLIMLVAYRSALALLIAAAVAYPVSWLIGIPMYLLLKKLRRFDPISFALAGGVAGFVVAVPLVFTIADAHTTLALGGVIAVCGAITAVVFWCIAFLRLRSNNRWRGP
jgi:hypothetical protein